MTGFLLDSHALLWLMQGAPNLSRAALRVLEDEEQRVLYSPVSIYELQLKMSRGRIEAFAAPLLVLAPEAGLEELPLTGAQADLAARLAPAHRDPWDRLLAAQAILSGLTLVSKDAELRALGATVLW